MLKIKLDFLFFLKKNKRIDPLIVTNRIIGLNKLME